MSTPPISWKSERDTSEQFSSLPEPDYVFLELTSHCNMHCTFCPSDGLARRRGHLNDEQARKVIVEIAECNLKAAVHLNDLGEPLLNKNIYEYIDLLDKQGRTVILITNLTLLTTERLQAILAHDNIVLVLSVQTPTEETFRLRQYDRIKSVSEYLEIANAAFRMKFLLKSKARIEFHLAQEVGGAQFQSDFGPRLWSLYGSDGELHRALQNVIEELSDRVKLIKEEFPEEWKLESDRISNNPHWARELAAGTIELHPDKMRRAAGVSPNDFWGWMFAPNCFLRMKPFGLWGRQKAFIERHLPPGSVAFLEEREEPYRCPMANNVVLLSGGEYTYCCLDYEGQMSGLDCRSTSLADFLRSEHRKKTLENAMIHQVCRRCQGNLFVFDTTPPADKSRAGVKYGSGWWAHEPNVAGGGGRWTNGHARCYFYAKGRVSELRLRLTSPWRGDQPVTLIVSQVAQGGSGSVEPLFETLPPGTAAAAEVTLPVNLPCGGIYRVALNSPTFVPRERFGTPDDRKLGVFIHSIDVVFAP